MTARNEESKKSFIQKMFPTKLNNGDGWKANKDSFSSFEIEPNSVEQTIMSISQDLQSLRVFAATWNVGGKSPNSGLDLDDLLQVDNESDIYVLGFQEIVPLNAGNVLVIEDNGSAAKWLSLISQSLNKCSNNTKMKRTNTTNYEPKPSAVFGSIKPPITTHSNSNSNNSPFFQRTSLKAASRVFRSESRRKLKSCNCASDADRKNISRDSCFACQKSNGFDDESSSEEEDASNSTVTVPEFSVLAPTSGAKQMKYSLVKSKQMVGIFVTIWVRKELVQYISHLRTSCISRGILGYLGNKGCISVSMSFKQTSFCFVCSHLASGEKEGDELRRNSDVIEIIKSTQFPKICKTTNGRMPEKILDHDRVLWLGDLNYRIALSYNDTRKLLEQNDWDSLLNKDQLKIERESGRVFKGWKEGKIFFAPTYKYSYNSDTYAGETIKSKSKRRTPAWCDRILWYGDGIQQKSYIRWESRFSDHRPVCATFLVDLFIF